MNKNKTFAEKLDEFEKAIRDHEEVYHKGSFDGGNAIRKVKSLKAELVENFKQESQNEQA